MNKELKFKDLPERLPRRVLKYTVKMMIKGRHRLQGVCTPIEKRKNLPYRSLCQSLRNAGRGAGDFDKELIKEVFEDSDYFRKFIQDGLLIHNKEVKDGVTGAHERLTVALAQAQMLLNEAQQVLDGLMKNYDNQLPLPQ